MCKHTHTHTHTHTHVCAQTHLTEPDGDEQVPFVEDKLGSKWHGEHSQHDVCHRQVDDVEVGWFTQCPVHAEWCQSQQVANEVHKDLNTYGKHNIKLSNVMIGKEDIVWSLESVRYHQGTGIYSLSNVILVDEKSTSFHRYLRYRHNCDTIVFSIPGTILWA